MYELFILLINFSARDRKGQSCSCISSLINYLLAFLPFITIINNRTHPVLRSLNVGVLCVAWSVLFVLTIIYVYMHIDCFHI